MLGKETEGRRVESDEGSMGEREGLVGQREREGEAIIEGARDLRAPLDRRRHYNCP